MNCTETLSNNNSTIIILINYNQDGFTNLEIYKISVGKFILLQKIYIKSESIKTFTIYNRFYFLSYSRTAGNSSIYKWKNQNFIFDRIVEIFFQYFKSEDDVIIAVENEVIKFYTNSELTSISPDTFLIKNQTDLFIHKGYFIEFYVEKYKMLMKFIKIELTKENEKILTKIKNNAVFDCLKSLKTNLFERQAKIQQIVNLMEKSTTTDTSEQQINVKNSRIERLQINLKPVISSKELMKRVTILEMRLNHLNRRKRAIDNTVLNTVVVNNLIHTGDIFNGELIVVFSFKCYI